MAADGIGKPADVTPDAVKATDPAWSPDDTRLLYVDAGPSSGSHGPPLATLVSIAPDGSGRTVIDIREETWIAAPAWQPLFAATRPSPTIRPTASPVPEDIASAGVLAFAGGPGQNVDIYTVGTNGRDLRRCTTDRANELRPRWSPDGRLLVFDGNAAGTYDVYVANADGSAVRRLTTDPADDGSPDWSPDGARIAFEGQDGIWVMNADGTEAHLVTHDQAAHGAPRWSPDGTQLAFDDSQSGAYEVWVIGVDGTGLHQLSHDGTGAHDPAWSSDGRFIAFTGSQAEVPVLKVIRADGTGEATVFDAFAVGSPSWRPVQP
jgi:dipeptidyl aminopeptidase/acylaminoacyl peptidase